MQALQSKSKVLNIRERDGECLVAFVAHDGYFTVPQTPDGAKMRARISQARQDGVEIGFEYDTDLNILKLL